MRIVLTGFCVLSALLTAAAVLPENEKGSEQTSVWNGISSHRLEQAAARAKRSPKKEKKGKGGPPKGPHFVDEEVEFALENMLSPMTYAGLMTPSRLPERPKEELNTDASDGADETEKGLLQLTEEENALTEVPAHDTNEVDDSDEWTSDEVDNVTESPGECNGERKTRSPGESFAPPEIPTSSPTKKRRSPQMPPMPPMPQMPSFPTPPGRKRRSPQMPPMPQMPSFPTPPGRKRRSPKKREYMKKLSGRAMPQGGKMQRMPQGIPQGMPQGIPQGMPGMPGVSRRK